MTESVSKELLDLWLTANNQLSMAQSNSRFVQSFIEQTYKLNPEDQVDTTTGIITRSNDGGTE